MDWNINASCFNNILLKFIEANEPVFYAVKTYTNGAIDFTNKGNMIYSIGTNKEWVINISQSFVVLYKKEWMSKSVGCQTIPVLYLRIDSKNLVTLLQGQKTIYTLNLEVGKGGQQATAWANWLSNQLGTPYNSSKRINVSYHDYGPFSYSPQSQCNIWELTAVTIDFERIASKKWSNIL